MDRKVVRPCTSLTASDGLDKAAKILSATNEDKGVKEEDSNEA